MKPMVVDAKGRKLTNEQIWGGTKCKVSALLIPYFMAGNGYGCSLQLKAVQIIDLVSGKDGDMGKHGFKEEKGYESPDTDSATEDEVPEETEDFLVLENLEVVWRKKLQVSCVNKELSLSMKHLQLFTLSQLLNMLLSDFILPNGIIIEAKGQFVSSDRSKHKLIKEQHPDLDIRFVFSNSRTRIGKKSKTTYAMWCDRFGFNFF